MESNETQTQLEEEEVSRRDDNNAEDIQQEMLISTSPDQIVHKNSEEVRSLNA